MDGCIVQSGTCQNGTIITDYNPTYPTCGLKIWCDVDDTCIPDPTTTTEYATTTPKVTEEIKTTTAAEQTTIVRVRTGDNLNI